MAFTRSWAGMFVISAGALLSRGFLPLERAKFERQEEMNFQADKLALNVKAFRLGVTEIEKSSTASV
jgi:Pyruvate/2-oxoacid:ferredoxin oxidoreductase gamma subunit